MTDEPARDPGSARPSTEQSGQASRDKPWRRLITGVALSSMLGYGGWRRDALAKSGAGGAVIVGTSIYLGGGPRWSAWLLAFFVSSSALSRVKGGSKAAAATEYSKGDRRDLGQALANGGVAALCGLLQTGLPAQKWPGIAAAAALAEANADTWATELGTLSKTAPRLITTGRRVPAGTSGGVTLIGVAAATTGAGLIATLAALLAPRGTARNVRRRNLAAITVAGVGGSLADSLLGATVQAIYLCPACQQETERTIHRCGTPTVLTRGYGWLDNDVVNALSTAIAALVGVLLAH